MGYADRDIPAAGEYFSGPEHRRSGSRVWRCAMSSNVPLLELELIHREKGRISFVTRWLQAC